MQLNNDIIGAILLHESNLKIKLEFDYGVLN